MNVINKLGEQGMTVNQFDFAENDLAYVLTDPPPEIMELTGRAVQLALDNGAAAAEVRGTKLAFTVPKDQALKSVRIHELLMGLCVQHKEANMYYI